MGLSRDAAIHVEYSVIGSMLVDVGAVPVVLNRVEVEDFASELDRRLYECIRALYRSASTIDPITVADKAGWSDDKDKRQYLAELIETTPTSANIAEYCEILHNQALLRLIRDKALGLTQAITLDECREPLTAMTEAFYSGQRIEAWTMEEMLTDFASRMADTGPREYISLGIRPIDENTYLERGDIVMLGGSPSDGKTALALTMAYHMSAKLNVGFYSLETGREKLEDRLVSSGFQLSFNAIKKGELNEDDWTRFAENVPEATGRRLTVLRASGMTAEQIAASSRARGFEAIFIDYGQLISPTNTKNTTRAEQMAEVSRTLHTFAQTTKTLVVLLLQLTRQERNSKRERDMFDLGESSQFEKDADLILLLYRPPQGTHFIEDDKDSEILDPDKTRILRVAKQKEGMRTRLPLAFDGDHQSFYVLNENTYNAIWRTARDARKSKEKETEGQQFLALPMEEEANMPF